jgi:hypothetical protein
MKTMGLQQMHKPKSRILFRLKFFYKQMFVYLNHPALVLPKFLWNAASTLHLNQLRLGLHHCSDWVTLSFCWCRTACAATQSFHKHKALTPSWAHASFMLFQTMLLWLFPKNPNHHSKLTCHLFVSTLLQMLRNIKCQSFSLCDPQTGQINRQGTNLSCKRPLVGKHSLQIRQSKCLYGT